MPGVATCGNPAATQRERENTIWFLGSGSDVFIFMVTTVTTLFKHINCDEQLVKHIT